MRSTSLRSLGRGECYHDVVEVHLELWRACNGQRRRWAEELTGEGVAVLGRKGEKAEEMCDDHGDKGHLFIGPEATRVDGG